MWLNHFVPWMHRKVVTWCNDATNRSIQILPSRPWFSSFTWKPSLFARAPAVGALCSISVMPMRPSPLLSVKRIRESSGKMGSATVSFQRPWWVDEYRWVYVGSLDNINTTLQEVCEDRSSVGIVPIRHLWVPWIYMQGIFSLRFPNVIWGYLRWIAKPLDCTRWFLLSRLETPTVGSSMPAKNTNGSKMIKAFYASERPACLKTSGRQDDRPT